MSSNSIIFVHGTWSPDAAWTKLGSPLREAIQKQCPKWSIYENSFIWSGKNTVQARYEAANELSNLINCDQTSKYILIAHSHGGNIALQSLRGCNETAIEGIICINTPFMNFLKKDNSPYAEQILFASLVFLSSVGWLYLCINVTMPYWQYSLTALFVFFFSTYILKYLYANRGSTPDFINKWLSKKWSHYRNIMDHPTISDVPIFCINSSADEAFNFLSVIDGFSNWPMLLCNRYNSNLILLPILFMDLILLKKFSSYYGIYDTKIYKAIEQTPFSFLLNILHFPDLSTFHVVFNPTVTNSIILKYFATGFEVMCLGSLYTLVSFLSFMLLSILFGLPFRVCAGVWNEPLMPFFARIFVSLTPINCERVRLKIEEIVDGGEPLHSSYYDNTSVISEIVDWINSR